jgi:hypothetical protein
MRYWQIACDTQTAHTHTHTRVRSIQTHTRTHTHTLWRARAHPVHTSWKGMPGSVVSRTHTHTHTHTFGLHTHYGHLRRVHRAITVDALLLLYACTRKHHKPARTRTRTRTPLQRARARWWLPWCALEVFVALCGLFVRCCCCCCSLIVDRCWFCGSL